MRIGRINDMTIAIIIKAVHLEKIKYVVKLPNNKGDESLQFLLKDEETLDKREELRVLNQDYYTRRKL